MQGKHESRIYFCQKCNNETKQCADLRKHVKNKHEGKREGEAFKAEINDKLKNTDEHDDDNDVSNARNATKDIEIEIDDAYDETEVTDTVAKVKILKGIKRRPKRIKRIEKQGH